MIEVKACHCAGDLGAQPFHCHEEVEFVAVYQGQGSLRRGRARHYTGSGVLSVVCPQEAHAGSPLAEDFAVQGLNVSVEWFEASGLDRRLLWRKESICGNASVLAAFLQAYETVRQKRPRLHQDEALLARRR